MPELSTTQQILWRLITAPEGVAKALDAWAERDRWLPHGLEGVVRGDEVPALERLDIYANMYFFRLLDSLKEDFPGLLAVLGDEGFHNLVTDYLLVHPSEHPSLRHLGRAMAGFVCGHAAAGERPWLGDLARLEWALLEAFDAADSVPVGAERLQAIPPEDWGRLHFSFTPSLHVVEARAAVDEILDAVAERRAPGPPAASVTTIRIWRQGLRVRRRAIDREETTVLGAAREGESFAALCERLSAGRSEEEAAARAVGLLANWITEELVVGIEVE